MKRRSGEPVRHTCPDIDRIISTITSIVSDMDRCSNDDEISDLIDNINTWSYNLTSIGHGNHCELEDLRASNNALRTWGNDLYQEAEQLDTEIERLNNEIERLESKVTELEDENSELKEEILTQQQTI